MDGIRENAGLNPVALQSGDDGFDAADLHDGDILFGHETEMAHRDAGAGID